jgi:predicted 3-demethylubiquinone-9 3-methyltransferase (glyoxalase superfamily)
MGNTLSENVINSHINSVFDVLNSSTNNCITNVYQTNEITFSCSDCDVVIEGEFNQYVDASVECYSEAEINTCVSNAVTQTASQNAEAISKRFGLSEASTSNLTNMLVNFSTEATTVILQNCIINSYQTNRIVGEVESGTITVVADFNQEFWATTECSQTIESQTKSFNQVQQYIDQVATSQVNGILGSSTFIIIVIVCITAVLIFNGDQIFKSIWKICLLIVGILFAIGLYFLIAFLVSWPPFQTPPDAPPVCPSECNEGTEPITKDGVCTCQATSS